MKSSLDIKIKLHCSICPVLYRTRSHDLVEPNPKVLNKSPVCKQSKGITSVSFDAFVMRMLVSNDYDAHHHNHRQQRHHFKRYE